jgi:hypothetical protein
MKYRDSSRFGAEFPTFGSGRSDHRSATKREEAAYHTGSRRGYHPFVLRLSYDLLPISTSTCHYTAPGDTTQARIFDLLSLSPKLAVPGVSEPRQDVASLVQLSV